MTKRRSPLLEAADALAAELQGLEALLHKAQREPLTSQKNFERAARTLGGVAELEQRLRGALTRMAEALGEAGQRQQAALQALGARAQELEGRFASYQELRTLRDQVDADCARVNETIRGVLDSNGAAAAVLPALEELGRIAEQARQLFALSKERDFHDITREADSIQQRLQSLRRKLTLLAPAQGRGRDEGEQA